MILTGKREPQCNTYCFPEHEPRSNPRICKDFRIDARFRSVIDFLGNEK